MLKNLGGVRFTVVLKVDRPGDEVYVLEVFLLGGFGESWVF